jgi:phosphate transport system substrate-binding protein
MHVGDFIEFAVSNYGQQMVESVSFIPQKITTQFSQVNKDHPIQYQQMALNGERVSVTFRMRADRAEIDNKSIQDIEHLAAFLKNKTYKKITLVAFSAQETGEQEDKNRAYIRTKLLAFELNQRGVKNVEIIAMGTQLPIDSSDSDLGRYRNNRTEIWLINDSNKQT